jgi:hypothetical protein
MCINEDQILNIKNDFCNLLRRIKPNDCRLIVGHGFGDAVP